MSDLDMIVVEIETVEMSGGVIPLIEVEEMEVEEIVAFAASLVSVKRDSSGNHLATYQLLEGDVKRFPKVVKSYDLTTAEGRKNIMFDCEH